MKWYFAVGGKPGIDMLLEERVKSILTSFAFFRKGIPDNLVAACKRGVNVMVDSGGFTNGLKPGSVRLEDYLEFLKEWGPKVTEYVVLDDPRKRLSTLKAMEQMIKQGYKPLFVDHIWFKWASQLDPSYKAGAKVCWGGIGSSANSAVGDWAKSDRWRKISDRINHRYLKAAAAPKSNIHLLAVGQRLRRFLPWFDVVDSFDAATWSRAPAQYGKLCMYYPATKEKPYPIFRQISSESYSGTRPPKEVFDQADRYGLDLNKYEDRIRMAIRELKKYFRAIELFHAQEKSKGLEHLREISIRKDEPFPDNERPILIQVQWQEKLPGDLASGARKSKSEDAVEPGRYFYQPKPTPSAPPEQEQSIERLIKLFEQKGDTWLSGIVQKKYGGVRHQIHKDGETVKIWSADGDETTDRLPSVVAEVKELKPGQLVLDVEIEMWAGRSHLPRDVAANYLHGTDKVDDSGIVVNVFDPLFVEKDIHGLPLKERVKILSEIGIKQKTMGVPDVSKKLNEAPCTLVRTSADVERATRKIRKLPGSGGVVVKQADSRYPLDLVTEKSWVKYHNASTIRGVITGRTKTGGKGWVYQYGVLPGRKPPVKLVGPRSGAKLTMVGDSFATKRELAIGEGILIEGEEISVSTSGDGIEMTVWMPRVLGPWEGKPDTVDTVTARAKTNLVLQEKIIDESGGVRYVPSGKVEKQADPYLEVPDEEKTYRYTVQNHFRGKGFHTDIRIEFRPGKSVIGWTLNTQVTGTVKEPVTTLDEAKEQAKRMKDISKVNWLTGDFNASIGAEKKVPGPVAWLDSEGSIENAKTGVLHIVDKGQVEFGAQKSDIHEYFFKGKSLFGRIVIKQGGSGGSWTVTKPGEPTPYILSSEAVEGEWMPPVGYSALPKEIQSQIPKQLRYWEAKSTPAARVIRDELAKVIASKEVSLDYESAYRRQTTKEQLSEPEILKTEGYMPIVKANDEKRLVTGIVLEPDTIDAQNDTIDAETIERAAHAFLSNYNRETELGLLHRMFGKIGVELVECWITPQDMKIGGVAVAEGTWIMTVKVISEGVWRKIKDGTITGFSIGGMATVVPAVA